MAHEPQPTVLLVDDVNPARNFYVGWFASMNFQVVGTSRGDVALAMIAEGPPDLLVLEFALPGLCGLDVIRRVRRSSTAADLPILVLTSSSDPVLRQRAETLGVPVVSKLADPVTLWQTILAITPEDMWNRPRPSVAYSIESAIDSARLARVRES